MKTSHSKQILTLLLAFALLLAPASAALAAEELTGIALSQSSLRVEQGKTAALTVLPIPEEAVLPGIINWTSSDTTVATVSDAGVVSGISGGTANIIAAAGSFTAVCDVTVTVPVADVTLNEAAMQLSKGQTQSVTATVAPSNATDQTVVWTSSDPAVASVAPDPTSSKYGTITAVSAGMANITASSGGVISRACVVTVSGIVLSERTASVVVSGSIKLDKTAYGAARNVVSTSWEWRSSNTAVARVDPATGQVTGIEEGEAVITCMSADGSYSDSCALTVMRNEAATIRYTLRGGTLPFTSILSNIDTSCRTLTGSSLNYVTGLQVRTSQGTLYENYLSEGDPGAGVASSGRYYVSGEGNRLTSVSFVPKPGFNGIATITYTGYSTGGQFYNGEIVVTVQQPTANLAYASYGGEAIQFNAEDFSYYSQTVTGRAIRSISFVLPSEQYGVLKFHKLDNELYESTVSASTRYYRGATPSLDDVWFVPRQGYNGSFLLGFYATDTSGVSYSGNVSISVSHSGAFERPEISYSISNSQTVRLRSADFDQASYSATSHSLSHIRFTSLPAASQGTLYWRGDSKVSAGTYYYLTPSGTRRLIQDVSFTPAARYTGSFTVPFTGTNDWDENFSGTIRITVTANGATDVMYAVQTDQRLSFRALDFEQASYTMTGSPFSYLYFENLPLSTQGTLYMSGSVVASTSNAYYASGSTRLLDTVTFLPASAYAGLVVIPYTAYGENGSSFTGSINITVTNVASPGETLVYHTTGPAVHFQTSDFTSVISKQLNYSLTGITFTAPSAGEGRLCLGYVSPTQYTVLDASKSYTSTEISSISFQPRAGYRGTVYIPYTAKNSFGRTYKGSVAVEVSPPTQSAWFTDMWNYSWAVSSVDFLRYYGILNGTSANTYSPAGNTKRGDFILMLSRAFSFPSSDAAGFRDVPAGSYYASAITAARALGVATGDEHGNFRPEEPITRQDAAVLLYRAMRRKGSLPSANIANLAAFPDRNQVASYAVEPMGSLVRLGVFAGDENSMLNPTKLLTRAEMAVLFHRAVT